jgi:anti-sigma B factor antagonist
MGLYLPRESAGKQQDYKDVFQVDGLSLCTLQCRPDERSRETVITTDSLVIERSHQFPLEVLELKGPLTAANAAVFQNAMRREEPAETVILDFTEVPYIDSSGLGTLLTAYVTRQKSGRKMVLSGINPRVQKLFDVTRTGALFLIFSTPEEAIAALWGAARA